MLSWGVGGVDVFFTINRASTRFVRALEQGDISPQ